MQVDGRNHSHMSWLVGPWEVDGGKPIQVTMKAFILNFTFVLSIIY